MLWQSDENRRTIVLAFLLIISKKSYAAGSDAVDLTAAIDRPSFRELPARA